MVIEQRKIIKICLLLTLFALLLSTRVNAVELPEHPFFVGVQFHPEFKSRPDRPHPIFRGFIQASLERKH